jgi:hypothetical protein
VRSSTSQIYEDYWKQEKTLNTVPILDELLEQQKNTKWTLRKSDFSDNVSIVIPYLW